MSSQNHRSHSPGHIRRRVGPTGVERWQAIVSYRVGDQRKTLSGTRATRREAQKLLLELLEQAHRLERRSASTSGVVTVTQLLDRFESRRRERWSASTVRQWASVRKNYYDPKWGDRAIADVDPIEVEDWLEDLANGDNASGRPLSRATIKRILNPISSAFAYAVNKRLIADNPFVGAEFPGGASRSQVADYPDIGGAVRVLAALKDDTVTFTACQLAADTGMRRGELCGLRFCDLDLEGGILHVRRRAVIGENDLIVVQDGTKTQSGRRLMLARPTLGLLRDYRRYAMDEAARVGYVWDEDVFVFSTPGEPQLPLRPDVLSARWRRACAANGVQMRFHELRHLHATTLLSNGCDLGTVANRLGHSGGGRMTLEAYAHRVREVELIAAEEVAAQLRPETTEEESNVD